MIKLSKDYDKKIKRILTAMAYNRESFKDKVEEHIRGALLEFYKARLATKNQQTKWVKHWMTEVHTLLDFSLFSSLRHGVKGFKDRNKAIEEVVNSIKMEDSSYRRIAETIIKRDYNIIKIKNRINDVDTKEFWNRVRVVIETALMW